MRNPIHRIAIVGSGPSGIGVFCELLEALKTKGRNRLVSITLIEKSSEFGSGLPYCTKLDAHVINMAVATMSLRADEPDHFYRWLLANKKLWAERCDIPFLKEGDVVPRSLFALYVNHMYQDARETAQSLGVDITTIIGEATDVCENSDGVRVTIDNKDRYYDQVFLCIGNQSAIVGREFDGLPGYFHDAWPEDRIMASVPRDEPVTILGSGLTAIDVLITLQENRHRAPLTMVSRHGLLPKVRNRAKPYELVHISPRNLRKLTQNGAHSLSLANMIQLLKAEFANADAQFGRDADHYRAADTSAVEVLKEDIARVRTGHANYFSVLKAIDEQIGEIWNAMSLEARFEFDQYFRTIWNTYCYPMPLQNGLRVLAALESGQVSVRGGLRDISHDAARQTYRLLFGAEPEQEIVETRFIINATGQGTDITRCRNTLLEAGMRNGSILPHPLGGIDVDFQTCRAKSNRPRHSGKLYVVGLLTRGVHFYTNSIIENVRCGKRAAIDAVERLAEDTPLAVPVTISLGGLANATAALKAGH